MRLGEQTLEGDGELVLRPSCWWALGLALGSAAFVAAGVWILVTMPQERWKGVAGVAFFSVCLIASIISMLPGSTWLRITREELVYARLFRVTRIPWHEIDEFFVVTIGGWPMPNRIVGFDRVASVDRARKLRTISTMVAGCEDGLPCTYGRKPQELADLLNECLAAFAPMDDASAAWDEHR